MNELKMQDVAIPSSKIEDLVKLVKKNFPKKIVIFDFWNESCNPCVFQHKILQQIEKTTDNSLIIYRVDIAEEENYQFVKENKISTLPTLIIFKKNRPFSLIGLTQLEDITYFLDTNPKLCINCKKLNLKKSDKPEHYYCKKHKIYVYFKDFMIKDSYFSDPEDLLIVELVFPKNTIAFKRDRITSYGDFGSDETITEYFIVFGHPIKPQSIRSFTKDQINDINNELEEWIGSDDEIDEDYL